MVEGAESGSTETAEKTESYAFGNQDSHSTMESVEESTRIGSHSTTESVEESTIDSQGSEAVIETTTVDSNSCPWFLCNNTRCVLDTWRCDLQDDCGDNSDEEGCEKSSCDATEQFRCSSGMCISKDWLCDWIKDCPYGDDEDNC